MAAEEDAWMNDMLGEVESFLGRPPPPSTPWFALVEEQSVAESIETA